MTMGTTEIIWLIIVNFVMPIASLFVTEQIFRVRKTRKRSWLYGASVISSIIAWPLSNIFLPLAFISMPIVMYVAFLYIAKQSPGKSIAMAIVFTLLFYVVMSAITIAIFSSLGFS